MPDDIRRRQVAAVERAYSTLTIKAVNDEERTITGIATTPTPDSYGDIVEPDGAEFDLPLPLLYQHDSRQPIGHVTKAKVTKDGIEIVAKLVKATEPGRLMERLDEAWQSIKLGLVRGLSIGFRPIKHAYLDDSYGIQFIKWRWLELSAVTIPANSDCSIETIKSIDTAQRAAIGTALRGVTQHRRTTSPGASGTKPTNPGVSKMNTQELLKAAREKRAAAMKKMDELMSTAAEEGRDLDEGEEQIYNDAKSDVLGCDKSIGRLEEHEKLLLKNAARIPTAPNSADTDPDAADKGSEARGGAPRVLRYTEKLGKGIEFARFVRCLAAAKGNEMQALELAKQHFPDSPRLETVLKAAVAAGTTSDPTWAGPLLEYNQFAGDFVEFLRPQTIVGRFGMDGIPSLLGVPFNVHVRGQTSGGDGYWVGQGAPKPVTKFDFVDAYIGFTKCANIAVLTQEMIRFSNPKADTLTLRALADAIRARLDIDFVDPSKAEVANVSPASITNGVSPIASAGPTLANARTDANAAMQEFIDANIALDTGVWIMSMTTALALSQMRNALGQKEHPDLTMKGGTYEGLPVITSQYMSPTSGGGNIILASAGDIWLADDGQVTIRASDQASIEMLTNPTNNSASATATSMVSMFQTNSVAMLAERYIYWKKRRTSAVAMISNVNYSVNA